MPEMKPDFYYRRELVSRIMSYATDWQLARSIWSMEFNLIGISEHDINRYIETLKKRSLLSSDFSLENIRIDDGK